MPAGRIAPGEVIYTMGWPLTAREYGGAWIYGGKDNVVSLGFVTGLDYRDPRLDPQHVLQEFKKHSFVTQLLAGGKMIRYGAKSMPYGGWWAVPPLAGDGWMIIGDSAGLLNSQRLKGIHLAIKSGMLAAETAFEALKKNDSSAAMLGQFQKKVESSWIKDELWKVRNFHQGFEHGFWPGMFHTALQQITGGYGVRNRYPSTLGYQRMKKLAELPASGGAEAHLLGPAKGDGKLTFDKLTDLYHSGTRHEEDQPAHLILQNTDVCNERCIQEFGSPCQNFCPANVYELVDDITQPEGKRISLNPSNCVHCKACDIADPYQIITWVPPEGGRRPELRWHVNETGCGGRYCRPLPKRIRPLPHAPRGVYRLAAGVVWGRACAPARDGHAPAIRRVHTCPWKEKRRPAYCRRKSSPCPTIEWWEFAEKSL